MGALAWSRQAAAAPRARGGFEIGRRRLGVAPDRRGAAARAAGARRGARGAERRTAAGLPRPGRSTATPRSMRRGVDVSRRRHGTARAVRRSVRSILITSGVGRLRCLLSRISSRRAGRTSDWSAWDPVSTEVERQRFRLLVEEQKNEQAPNPAAFALPAGGLRARRPGDDGKPGRRRTAAGSRRRSAWATRWRPAPAPRNRPTSRKGR